MVWCDLNKVGDCNVCLRTTTVACHVDKLGGASIKLDRRRYVDACFVLLRDSISDSFYVILQY